MKKLFLASLALATLASCQKESTIDTALTANQAIKFAPYAGASTTKGAPVNSNEDFQGTESPYGSFKVASYSGTDKYFGFNTVTWNGTDAWTNTDEMFWPNKDASLHFGAYYPTGATFTSGSTPAYKYEANAHSLILDYTISEDVAEQVDLMYALTDKEFEAPTTGTNDSPEVTASTTVGLHFKHALTQIGFTAIKDADIAVAVKSIKICNVIDKGRFTATANTNHNDADDLSDGTANENEDIVTTNFGEWRVAEAKAQNDQGSVTTNLQNYQATMAFVYNATTINVANDATTANPTQLTSSKDVLMLLPQPLTAWDPKGTNEGTESFLAIDCKITHKDGTAPIVEGIIYVPFNTDGIDYNKDNTIADDEKAWKPGYKITYNLNFGGGYTFPGGGDPSDPDKPKDPIPGETPNPDDVIPTLRAITYTVTVDEWIPVSGGDIDLEGTNTPTV